MVSVDYVRKECRLLSRVLSMFFHLSIVQSRDQGYLPTIC